MALEWTISEGRPVDPEGLIPRIETTFGRLTHLPSGLTRKVWPPGSPGDHEFSISLSLADPPAGRSTRVDLDQLNYDAATGTCYSYVESTRNALSVTLGIVAAVCWHAQAGAGLSGMGIEGWFSVPQSASFLEELFRGVTGYDDLLTVSAALGFPFE